MGRVCFHEAAQLTAERCQELQHVVQRRVLRYFHRHGLLDEADAHGMLSWQGSGGFSIGSSHQPRSHPMGRAARSHLRGTAAALPCVWRPHEDSLLDQTPAFDPTEAGPVPDFVFDPSLPDEFDD
jgi:hypothetical protein